MEGLCPKLFGKDAVEIPGARDLLASLDAAEAPWAIVTSGTRPLIQGWLDVMRLAKPKRMVTAEDVSQGKPGESSCLQSKDESLTNNRLQRPNVIYEGKDCWEERVSSVSL